MKTADFDKFCRDFKSNPCKTVAKAVAILIVSILSIIGIAYFGEVGKSFWLSSPNNEDPKTTEGSEASPGNDDGSTELWIYRKFEINTKTGGAFESCQLDKCFSGSVSPAYQKNDESVVDVRIEFPTGALEGEAEGEVMAKSMEIAEVLLTPGSYGFVRRADYDFKALVEDVQFDNAVISLGVQNGTLSKEEVEAGHFMSFGWHWER